MTWQQLTPAQIVGSERSAITIGPFGSNLRTVDYRESGVPLVFVRDIRRGTFIEPKHYVSPQKAAELQSHIALPGDVLITKMGEPPGDATVYAGKGPAIITADCIRLRPTPAFDAKYIALTFAAPAVRAQMEHITSGVAQRKVSLARFRSGIRIPVPSLAEQRRIVEILEDHLSHLDAAEAQLATVVGRLAALERSALAHAVAGNEMSLGDVADIQGGIQKQPKRAPRENAYPFLRVANVTAIGLDLNDVHRIELFDGELDRLRLASGDLLVVEGNGSPSQIGRAALWDGSISDCVHQNHLIRVRARSGLLPAYLEVVWNSPDNRARLTDLSSSSSGLHTLSVSKLRSLHVRVPAVPSQAAAVDRVTDVRERRRLLETEVEHASTRNAALRRSLLAAAFSGRLTGHRSDIDRAAEAAGA